MPISPSAWHVDPSAAKRTGRPNDYLVAEGGDHPPLAVPEAPAEVMARIDAVAMAEPRTHRLAGSPEEGFVTYVQRSRLVGYPDVISLRVVPDGTGSRVTVYSRSRYGVSDMGVNRKRVVRWMAAADVLQPAAGPAPQ